MKLTTIKGSENYQCQVIKLPNKRTVKGLDNLVEVNFQGNSCLVDKDSDELELYLFFPAECKISHDFLSNNNLYRHKNLNKNETKQGFFEDSGRVKALKFKGIISTGFIIPLSSIKNTESDLRFNEINFKLGDEFNEVYGVKICEKYNKPLEKKEGMKNTKTKVIDGIVDSKFAPEHCDTSHLMKNIHKLNLDDYIAVTYKLHGTSARYFNTLVKRKLTWKDKLAKFFGAKVQVEEYGYISASRRVVKSVGFETLSNKNHFFNSGDLWSEVGKEYFEGKLNQGEAVYCEIIGKTYTGEAIQHGYSYGLEKPKVYIYRISNINSQGIEIDLPYYQMIERSRQLGIEPCPEFYYGTLRDFIKKYSLTENILLSDDNVETYLNDIFYKQLLEKPSILDQSVVGEGFCLRVDKYGKPDIYKIKSKAFLLSESKQLDNTIVDLESTES